MLSHVLHEPREPVSTYVENLWVVRGHVTMPARQMLVPDAAFVVMFNLGEVQKVCDRREITRTTNYRASWVCGQQREPLVFEQSGRYHVVGIRFRPAGAFSLFRLPLSELLGHVVELETIWGSGAAKVRDALAAQPDDASVLRCLEDWLGRHLRDRPPPFLTMACKGLEDGLVVSAVAERIGVSRKHLHDEFNKKVGMPPKLFGRIQRLQRTIRRIGFGDEVDWADVAPAEGFFDQSHLINEFHELVNLTPSEYLARRSPYLGYVSIVR